VTFRANLLYKPSGGRFFRLNLPGSRFTPFTPGSYAQGRPLADATDAAALGPAPCCLGRLLIFSRYSLRSRIHSKRLINLTVSKQLISFEPLINFLYYRTLSNVLSSHATALYLCTTVFHY